MAGPVVVVLPEDMLDDDYEVLPIRAARSANCCAAAAPLLILGGGGWSAEACADMKAFAEANHLPVTTAFRNQDLIDNRHANFVGDLGLGVNPPLGKRIKESDLIIAVGPRLGEDDRQLHHVRTRRCRRRRWCMCMPAPRNSAASTRRRCRSTAAWRSSRPGGKAMKPSMPRRKDRCRGPCRLSEEHRPCRSRAQPTSRPSSAG
jgi:hypothetical protein